MIQKQIKKPSLPLQLMEVPKTVNLIQKKGSLNYEYKLEVDKEAINILGKGGSDTLAITSQRREMINGTQPKEIGKMQKLQQNSQRNLHLLLD